MVERKRISVTAQSAEDREALQEIARLIEEKNVVVGPGAGDHANPARDEDRSDVEETTSSASKYVEGAALRLLLDALPAATGICVGSELRYANAGFALAFGYRSPVARLGSLIDKQRKSR